MTKLDWGFRYGGIAWQTHERGFSNRMKPKLNRAQSEAYESAAEWSDILETYRGTFGSQPLSDDEAYQRTKPFIDLLDHLLATARLPLKLREGWETAKVLFNVFGLEITHHHPDRFWMIHFGYDLDGFMFQTNLSFDGYLPSMHDDFWLRLCRLSELGRLEHIDGGMPVDVARDPNTRALRQRDNSAIFSLVRDFVLAAQSESGNGGVGWLKLRFPVELGWPDLVARLQQAVAISYECNYQLYRLNYINLQRQLKSFRAKERPQE